jgi:hypothetical protein
MHYYGFRATFLGGHAKVEWYAERDCPIVRLWIAPHSQAIVTGIRLNENQALVQTGPVPAAWYSAERALDGAIGQPLLDNNGLPVVIPALASLEIRFECETEAWVIGTLAAENSYLCQ